MIYRETHVLRVAIAAVALAMSACGLGDDLPKGGNGNDTSDDRTGPLYERPVLEATSSEGRICTDRGAVVGHAEPGANVIAQGPGGIATTTARSSDGRFCVAVPLAVGRQNAIEVHSVHKDYGTSERAVLTLTHSGADNCQTVTPAATPAAQPTTPQISIVQIKHNAAAVEIGRDASMVDGDLETAVQYKAAGVLTNWGADDMYIWFTLNTVHQIRDIEVHWLHSKGQGKNYAESWSLGVSAAAKPGEPPSPPGENTNGAPQPSDWTYIWRKSLMSSAGGKEVIDLSSKLPLAQHVALWLDDDATFGLDERYTIAEVVIHAAASTTPYVPVYSDNSNQDVCAAHY